MGRSNRFWIRRLARPILWGSSALDMQGKKAMVDIKGVAHFTIPVSDMERSRRFYTEIVGMKHLATLPNGKMAFFDAGGTCIILVKRDAPIHRQQEGSDGVH